MDCIRAMPNDPNRCNGDSRGEQCPYLKAEGSDFCPRHGNRTVNHAAAQAEARSYKLTKWKGRVSAFTDSSGIKSLREEIGIARMTMEQIVEKCEDPHDILMNSHKISQMLERIEKLVLACDKLETKMLLSIDKSTALLLAEQITTIISEEIEDADVVTTIAERIGKVILTAGSTDLSNKTE